MSVSLWYCKRNSRVSPRREPFPTLDSSPFWVFFSTGSRTAVTSSAPGTSDIAARVEKSVRRHLGRAGFGDARGERKEICDGLVCRRRMMRALRSARNCESEALTRVII